MSDMGSVRAITSIVLKKTQTKSYTKRTAAAPKRCTTRISMKNPRINFKFDPDNIANTKTRESARIRTAQAQAGAEEVVANTVSIDTVSGRTIIRVFEFHVCVGGVYPYHA